MLLVLGDCESLSYGQIGATLECQGFAMCVSVFELGKVGFIDLIEFHKQTIAKFCY